MSDMQENMLRVKRNLGYALLALLAVFVLGTAGYHALGEGRYGWLDCFYMTFITISTIGYNETVDVTHFAYGRLFTVFIGIAGIGVLGYTLSTLTAFILESDLNSSWRRKKMLQKIAQLQDHYLVCGMGFIGSNVAHELATADRPCVVIDPAMAAIERYVEGHPEQWYVCGDATDDEVLRRAGIARARGLFAVVSDDSQNLMIALSARQLNPRLRIVARCHDPRNMDKLRKAGADEVVSLDYSGGVRIVSAMLQPQVMSFLDDMIKPGSPIRLEELAVPERQAGRPLADFLQAGRDCIVLALRQQGRWHFNPGAEQSLQGGDILMLMATPEGRRRMEAALRG